MAPTRYTAVRDPRPIVMDFEGLGGGKTSLVRFSLKGSQNAADGQLGSRSHASLDIRGTMGKSDKVARSKP